jgi:hypothetical protein
MVLWMQVIVNDANLYSNVFFIIIECKQRLQEIIDDHARNNYCLLKLAPEAVQKLKVHMKRYKITESAMLVPASIRKLLKEEDDYIDWLEDEGTSSSNSSSDGIAKSCGFLLLWRLSSLHHKFNVKRVKKRIQHGGESDVAAFRRTILAVGKDCNIEGLVS